jgi:hypothetical protein
MPQTNWFHVTNSCSKWGQKLYHLAESSNAWILGKWWWTDLHHRPFWLHVVGLLHVTQQPKNCLENTMEVSETSNNSIARQHSFCNTYTEQKDDVWILHRYSFQVLLFFSRKVITRRVYVIYTLRAYPWPILQVHEAKSVCQSYATPWDWRFHYVQCASLFYCWVFFFVIRPHESFQSVTIPTTYIVYASGTRTSVQKVVKYSWKSVTSVDIPIPDQQVEANTLTL